MMTYDHAPRILAQHRAEHDNRIMDDLEQLCAPLLMLLVVVAIALTFGAAYEIAAAAVTHYRELEARADGTKTRLEAQSDILARCMNGAPIGLGDEGIMRCRVTRYNLLPGVK